MNVASIIANLLIPTHPAFRPVCITLVILMGVAALAAIILVMLQPGNSQGIDALGGSSETFYGKNKGKSTEAKLKMWTYICLGILAVLAVVFFILQIEAIWAI
ncbi:MAG: preprotein translocase subunit SecG [Candidatus Gallimonas sp.]